MEGQEGLIVIVETKHYVRAFKKLPQNIQILAQEKIDLFRYYPTHAGLRVHKLEGAFDGFQAFWVNYNYRILYAWNDGVAVLYDIGTHKIYE